MAFLLELPYFFVLQMYAFPVFYDYSPGSKHFAQIDCLTLFNLRTACKTTLCL